MRRVTMRWLYAIPSSDTGVHSRATARSRSLALMSARISPVAAAASSRELLKTACAASSREPMLRCALALGTSIGNPDHDDSARIIHKALDAGINFIDTADAYGESEVAVGNALKGRRDSVVLATKFSRPIGDDPNHQGASRRWIVTAVENSLRRLQTGHIDLYQAH